MKFRFQNISDFTRRLQPGSITSLDAQRVAVVADRFGVTESYASALASKSPVSRHERLQRQRAIAAAIRAGEPAEQIADRLKVSYHAVYFAARLHGIQTSRLPGRPRSKTLPIIAALLNTSDSMGKIAKRIGCTHQLVSIVHKNAVEAGIVFEGRDGR